MQMRVENYTHFVGRYLWMVSLLRGCCAWRGGRPGRHGHVAGREVGAAGRAVAQPRRAGSARPAAVVVVVLPLEDLARGQVVHGEAVEPVKEETGVIFKHRRCDASSFQAG